MTDNLSHGHGVPRLPDRAITPSRIPTLGRAENVALEKNYRDGFDLEEIRATALTLGMVPVEEVKVIPVRVSIPEPAKPDTLWEQISWFVKGLFA